MSLRRCKEHKYGFMISLGDMLSDRTKTRGCYYCLLNEAIAFQKRIAELEEALRTFPFNAFGDALREGCDANGAWDCFTEEADEHIKKTLKPKENEG